MYQLSKLYIKKSEGGNDGKRKWKYLEIESTKVYSQPIHVLHGSFFKGTLFSFLLFFKNHQVSWFNCAVSWSWNLDQNTEGKRSHLKSNFLSQPKQRQLYSFLRFRTKINQ